MLKDTGCPERLRILSRKICFKINKQILSRGQIYNRHNEIDLAL